MAKKFLNLAFDGSESFLGTYDVLYLHCHKTGQTLDAMLVISLV